jgi:hypothetical protein
VNCELEARFGEGRRLELAPKKSFRNFQEFEISFLRGLGQYQVPDVAKIERGKKLGEISEYPHTVSIHSI